MALENLERVEKHKEILLRENEKLKVERGKTATQQVFSRGGHRRHNTAV